MNACLVFDDIYWSKGMAKAWAEIIEEVDFSVDLFRLGIVMLGDFNIKEHFKFKY